MPKQAAKPKDKKTAVKENPRQTLDKTAILPKVDINFCDVAVKGRLHAFLLFYLTPGQNCFHNAKQAALAAGYSESTACVNIYATLRKPEIQSIIKANEDLARQSYHEAAKRAIEIKKQRAFYDPIDYFSEETKMTKYGPKKVLGLKPLDKMTPEQRMCIDGMDVKGQPSMPVYQMPDRAKELNDIIKLDAEYSKTAPEDDEETREIIAERITIREAKRAQLPPELEYEIVDRPVETGEE